MMDTMTNRPAPGWYPAPDAPGMVRWWNGEQWIDWQEPAPVPPTMLDKILFYSAQAAKVWFLLLLLAFCLIVLTVVL